MDIVDQITAYDSGQLGEEEIVTFFQSLLNTGIIDALQGSYGRTAESLIERGLIERPVRKQDEWATGPYTMVRKQAKVAYASPTGQRTFRLILYGAFNALGLIGSECNGIAVLDEDHRRVLCDEIAIAPSGYYGASQEQVTQFEAMVKMTWAEFQSFINSHGRSRYGI